MWRLTRRDTLYSTPWVRPGEAADSDIPATQLGSKFSFILLLLGMILYVQPLFLFGIVLFSLTTIFQLITLPVEFNASHRALVTLEEQGILYDDELNPVRGRCCGQRR